jgi:hypothetical protein
MYVNLEKDYAAISYGGGHVEPGVLQERIDELRDMRSDLEEAGRQLDREDAAELKVLLDFRADVIRMTGAFDDTVVIVPDTLFEQYVRFLVHEQHGIDSSNLADYIKWGDYISALQRSEYRKVVLEQTWAWVRRQPWA